MLCQLKNLSLKQGLKTDIFSFCDKIQKKNKNCRVAMTTTYTNTSPNSENTVPCLVSGEGCCCIHVFLVYYMF